MSSSSAPRSALPDAHARRLSDELIEAAKIGSLGSMELLLAQGADPLLQDSRALIEAAQFGRAACVKRLIPLSDPKADNSAALRCAAYHGQAECVRLLIPVSDTMANEIGSTYSAALVFAAERGHLECLRLLLPVCDPLADNSRALTHAASLGRLDCLRLLLPVCDPRAGDFQALDSACRAGQIDCAAALLAHLLPQGDPPVERLRLLRERALAPDHFSSAPRSDLTRVASLLGAHLDAMELSQTVKPAPSRSLSAPRV